MAATSPWRLRGVSLTTLVEALPREHGGWAVLLLASATGALLTRSDVTSSGAALAMVVGSFIAYHSSVEGTRLRAPARAAANIVRVAAALVAGASAAILVARGRHGIIVWGAIAAVLGIAHARYVWRGGGRRLAAHLIGMAALSLAAPMMATAGGAGLSVSVLLALLVFVWAATSLFTVRLSVAPGRERDRAARHLLAWLFGSGAAASALGALVSPVFAALAVPLARAAICLARRPPRLPVRRVGVTEVAAGIAFVASATVLGAFFPFR